MRILVVLLLFLVGGLVLASRFGRDANPPGEIAVREVPAPVQDEGPAEDGVEPAPAGAIASPDEGGAGVEVPANGGATPSGQEDSGDGATEEAEDGPVRLRLDDAAEGSEPAPDAAPDRSPSGAPGPALEQPAAPGEEPAAMPLPDPAMEQPDEVPPVVPEPEAAGAPSSPVEPIPAEPLGPEEALAALGGEEDAANGLGPDAGRPGAETPSAPGADTSATAAPPVSPDDPSADGAGPAPTGDPQAEAASPGATPADPLPPEPARVEPPLAEPAPPAPPVAEPVPQAAPQAEPSLPPAPEVPLTPAVPEADVRRMVADRVNLREGPGTDRPVLEVLSLGDEVEVLEAEGDWLRVRSAGGEEGWVAARFVAPGAE